ncbi:amino acid adenylation domain-containing protein [Streptomyces sp. KR80]|uniref:amino acid adenylation domain-containing protein n=1 Tax=Streptomyces sp. KR80 TaxID=3457426 RepID=UPI003FCFA7B1
MTETDARRTTTEEKRRALLELRMRQRRAAQADRERITPVPRDGLLAPSYQQEGLWLLHQLDPASPVYSVPFALRLRGKLDTEALREAFRRLVGRHESLRTRFVSEAGEPRLAVDEPPAAWDLPVTDVPMARVRSLVEEEAVRPFDLAAGPLFRTRLLRLADDDHILTMSLHHIVTDGWSTGVIVQDLAALYEGMELPDVPLQAADFAAWQRRRLTGEVQERQLAYWRRTLDGLSVLDFPADRPRPPVPAWSGATLETVLSARLGDRLRELARTEQTSLLAVLQAGFLTVLTRYTGQEDLAVGSVFSGRTRSEVEPLVGFFANTLVLRTNTAGDPTFRELLRRCNDTVLGALAHQDVPFGMVVDALRPERDPSRNPLFQVSLTLQAAGTTGRGFGLPGIDVEPLADHDTTSRFDVGVTVIEAADGRLEVVVEYSTELFERGRMERLVDHFRSVLEQGVGAPDVAMGELELVGGVERRRVLEEWNPVPVVRSEDGLLLHEVVERQVGVAPSAVAMRFEGVELSYGELDASANRLAQLLCVDFGVGPGAVVGVLLDRSLDLPVAQLGVLKAGGAWLPLDPQHPVERHARCLGDARVPVVVTTRALAELLPGSVARVCVDDPQVQARLAQLPEARPVGGAVPDDLAYVIFTSGSTGVPKGVMVSHRAAVNFVVNARELFRIGPGDRLLQFANPAFDVSVFDFYGALGSGAAVVGAPRERLLDPDGLQGLLAEERVTVADVPPAVLRLLDPEPLTDLRALFVGLEAFPAELVNRWGGERREFHNGYGPTEATVACVDYRCPPEGLSSAPPIGRAMANHRAYVLDAKLRLVPVGVPGELFIAGTGLARGYLHQPALTAERFPPDPFSDAGGRMYRTGDVVRWREDGNLEFLGRADRQVKIRGLRIELGEVENAMTESTGVRQAVVTVHHPGTPQARLIGYAVPDAPGAVDAGRVRTELTERLPLHMVPSQVLVLDALPLTPNGKLDHAKLPEPATAQARSYTPPETATERELAKIWHGLLDAPLDTIGVYDGFFDLGGNSLQATRLISRIRDTFHITLPPRALFVHSVLRDLAARIDEAMRAAEARGTTGRTATGRSRRSPADDEPSPLVPLRATGTRPPLFLVHAVGGTVVPYVPLARLLDPEIPVYGLEHPGLAGARAVGGLAEAADSYLAAVREARPTGPYYLAGWSLGGSVALEMAARLRAAGEEVAMVALLDTGVPPQAAEPPGQAELLAAFAHDLAGLEGTEPPAVDVARLRRLPQAQQVDAVLPVLEQAGLIPAGVRDEVRTRIEVFTTNARAYHVHRPMPYDGRVTLLSAAAAPDDQADWWRTFATGGLDHHVVPGTHHTMLRPPHLPALARTLQQCLDHE